MEVSDLEQQLLDLLQENANLRGEADVNQAAHFQEKEALQTENNKLKIEKNKLQTEYTKLEAKVEELQSQLARLKDAQHAMPSFWPSQAASFAASPPMQPAGSAAAAREPDFTNSGDNTEGGSGYGGKEVVQQPALAAVQAHALKPGPPVKEQGKVKEGKRGGTQWSKKQKDSLKAHYKENKVAWDKPFQLVNATNEEKAEHCDLLLDLSRKMGYNKEECVDETDSQLWKYFRAWVNREIKALQA